MKQQLKRFLQQQVHCGEPELNTILDAWRHRCLKRNELLLGQGDVCCEFYFVVKGCLRVFFMTNTGLEKSNHIAPENTIISAMSSFISQEPSVEMIDALEDTEVLYLSREAFYRLVDESRGWELFYRKMLEVAYITKVRRIESLLTLTAKERYDSVLRNQPSLIQRVSNGVLASYIDVAPSTLSRLKTHRQV